MGFRAWLGRTMNLLRYDWQSCSAIYLWTFVRVLAGHICDRLGTGVTCLSAFIVSIDPLRGLGSHDDRYPYITCEIDTANVSRSLCWLSVRSVISRLVAAASPSDPRMTSNRRLAGKSIFNSILVFNDHSANHTIGQFLEGRAAKHVSENYYRSGMSCRSIRELPQRVIHSLVLLKFSQRHAGED